MADEATTADVDEAALRRDAEEALAALYPRVLDVERRLLEAEERARAQERRVVELEAQARAVPALEGKLAEARDENERLRAQLTEERLGRVAAEDHVAALEQTKLFRATAGARQAYGRLRRR